MSPSLDKYVYPSLNLYSSSRVFNQRVSNHKVPLLKYRELVRSNNCSRSHESDVVSSDLLRKLKYKDGLIFSLKKLKNQSYSLGGRMKILICVCMYNYPKSAINLTLEGIYSNLYYLKYRGIHPGDIGVVLIQDGILKLVKNRVKKTFVGKNNSMVYFYKQMDMDENKDRCDLVERINIICNYIQNYERRGMGSNVARNKDFPPSIEKNIALVYQNLWHPNKTKSQNFYNFKVPTDPNYCLKVFSCFKHSNGTKLSSHLWFFEGFCRYLKPEYCVLLDVGTTPDKDGLANLISGFTSERIGGVTGFMNVDRHFESLEEYDNKDYEKENEFFSCIRNAFFSIERAQYYEYVISHFLDKNQESALGFLHVLPGAWSAYRYDALIKSDKYEPNLLYRSYFKMMLNSNFAMRDLEYANMYLAEDRILSLGIYCQMYEKYELKYVPNAGARTDPMRTHYNLMAQRRRWINSSFFAFLYVFKNYYYNVMDSTHSFSYKYICLNLSMVIALISTFNSYITPSLFFFVLYATIYQLPFQHSDIAAAVVCLLYSFVFIAAVAGSLTGKQWTKTAHIISYVLSIFTFLLSGLVVYNIIVLYLKVGSNFNTSNTTTMIVIVLLILNVACFFSILLVHICTHFKNVCSIFANLISYTFYSGAYSQTMVIHAFCNVDDVSWGTKGSTSSGRNTYLTGKVFFVSSWLFYNALLTYIFIYVDIISRANDPSRPDVILLAIAIYGSAYLFLKTILALANQIIWMFCVCCDKKLKSNRFTTIDNFWKNEFYIWSKLGNYKHQIMDSNVYRR